MSGEHTDGAANPASPQAAPHIYRPPTRFEAMIDAATGHAGTLTRRTVTMRCPQCGRRQSAVMDPSDPPGTAVVSATCNMCPDDAAVIDYFDAAGRQIDLEGKVMT